MRFVTRTIHAYLDYPVAISLMVLPFVLGLGAGNPLAKWLAVGPRLLILDSPTVGVDVGARAGIFEIVERLAGEGLAILLISDEVPEVYFNADRVLHMAAGRIVGEYDPHKVSLTELEAAVYA